MCKDNNNSLEISKILRKIKHLFFDLRQPEEALKLCESILNKYDEISHRAELCLLYASICRWCNLTLTALKAVDKALSSHPPKQITPNLLLEKGFILSDLRKALSAINVLNMALEQISTINNPRLEAEVYLALGQAKSNAGMQKQAISDLDKSLEKALSHRIKNIIPTIYAHRALCEFRLGNIEKSRIEAEAGNDRGADDPLGMAECLRGIAIIHSVLGNSAHAIENYRKSLKIFREINYMPGLIRGYLSLGASYLRLGEIEMAEHFFKKALKLSNSGENPAITGMISSRLGSLYMARGDYQSALSCFEKDKELSKEIEDPSNIAHIYKNIGNCLFMIDDNTTATKNLTKSLEQFSAAGDKENQTLTEIDLLLTKIFSDVNQKDELQSLSEKVSFITSLNRWSSENNPLKKARLNFVEACMKLALKEISKAEELMVQTMGIAEEHLMFREEGEMVFLFGKLGAKIGESPIAIKWLRQALRVAETYSLGGMVKNVISLLDSIDEDNLVNYSFEKEAIKISQKELGIEFSPVASPALNIIGTSEAIKSVLAEAKEAAETDATILCIGQTGTGKELLARAIHGWSRRAGKKFIAVNCGAIPKELVESTLFGHVKGAFSGAVSDHIGSIEAANGGTIFLDEITELPLASQVKLLRFLEYKEIQPLGVAEAKKVDVRVIASTNREPVQSVKDGILREDLYYRISVIPIYLPPLSERGDDVIQIAKHLIATIPLSRKKGIKGLTPAAETWLKKQPWPGNIRELGNVILRAVIFARASRITVEDLENSSKISVIASPKIEKLDNIIKRHITEALKICNGNQVKAAKLLGIHRNTLRNKIISLSIKVP